MAMDPRLRGDDNGKWLAIGVGCAIIFTAMAIIRTPIVPFVAGPAHLQLSWTSVGVEQQSLNDPFALYGGDMQTIRSLSQTRSVRSRDVQLIIRGDDYESMAKVVTLLRERAASSAVVELFEDNYPALRKEYHVAVDDVRTLRAGMSPAQVGGHVQAAFVGEIATTIRQIDSELDVVVMYPAVSSISEGVDRLVVGNERQQVTPFPAVASVQEDEGRSMIHRIDRMRAVTLTLHGGYGTLSWVKAQAAALRHEHPQLFVEVRRSGLYYIARGLWIAFGIGYILGLAVILTMLPRTSIKPLLIVLLGGQAGICIVCWIAGIGLGLAAMVASAGFFGLVAALFCLGFNDGDALP
jgi:multidrug efflux pump subunit AcrB